NHPFAQAELLPSKHGSRLLRALGPVKPNVTHNQFHRVISRLSDIVILDIEGLVRRNLVWALEMLVFHTSCVDKSAW
ncbi:hypothetical protein CWB76_19665, partial [Pseudoalteromonas sp. S1609]|uniref:hypothetical protein n=1 Tax=Pseudoalteromonas sp. S1609 TaxID=579505 RepID=UPI00110B939E